MRHTPRLLTRVVAEVAGTCVLVLIGCGAIVLNERTAGALGAGGVALAFGVAVGVAILAFGNTSGAHINPAVTVAFWSGRQLPGRDVGPYVFGQCLGATAGALVLAAAFGADLSHAATLPRVSLSGAFLLEALMSFFLMFMIEIVARHDGRIRLAAPLVIGFAVSVDAYLGGSFTGASMNPARSFGPAVVIGAWDAHWLYWVAPILGMVTASKTVEFFDPKLGQEPQTLAGDAWGVEGPLARSRFDEDRLLWLRCAEVSAACVSACEAHADHPTARPCAEASRHCADLCRRMANVVGWSPEVAGRP